MDPYLFGKLDPDPHQNGKLDPDPDSHQSENQDPDPHRVKRWKSERVILEHWRVQIVTAVDTFTGSRRFFLLGGFFLDRTQYSTCWDYYSNIRGQGLHRVEIAICNSTLYKRKERKVTTREY